MNDVMKLIKAQNQLAPREVITIVNQEFDNTCQLTISLPLDMADEISMRLNNISGTSIL